MKILSVVGARPQFIKAAPLGKELTLRGHTNILVHTGQHYDYKLSQVFFDELGIPAPNYNLEVSPNSPINQMAEMMKTLEPIVIKENPDCAIVYGDTNSTLAAAVTILKLNIPIAHIEGGERNFTIDMQKVSPASIPEESNRVLVDHISEMIFCASDRAVKNLAQEGIDRYVFNVGDVMLDTFSQMSQMAEARSSILQSLGLEKRKYNLATVHRAINTDNPARLAEIIQGLSASDLPVIFPIHPRTKKMLSGSLLDSTISRFPKMVVMDPIGYFDMLELEKNAHVIVTDSGGVTREAYFAGVPGIIVDDTTAWIDLVHSGWSHLVGANAERIAGLLKTASKPNEKTDLLGKGDTSRLVVEKIEDWRK